MQQNAAPDTYPNIDNEIIESFLSLDRDSQVRALEYMQRLSAE